jgi:hypothetical protein
LECDESVSGPDAEALCALYESVFSHRRFTGRSGAMYKYEGLGCIYWHMVSKLALAVAELIGAAVRSGEDGSIVDALFERFEAIRQGLGLHKTPARYGAFPVDPYSHTPGFAGVQQPGMTGQVKEDVITRFMELGVRVADGEVSFEPLLLRGDEFLREAARWTYSAGGGVRREALPAGSLGFTLCGVPVVYRRAEAFAIRVFSEEGPAAELRGAGLGRDRSRSLFTRDGRVRRIEVDLPAEQLR